MAQHYGRNASVQQHVPGVDEALRRIMAERDVDATEAVRIYLTEVDEPSDSGRDATRTESVLSSKQSRSRLDMPGEVCV